MPSLKDVQRLLKHLLRSSKRCCLQLFLGLVLRSREFDLYDHMGSAFTVQRDGGLVLHEVDGVHLQF